MYRFVLLICRLGKHATTLNPHVSLILRDHHKPWPTTLYPSPGVPPCRPVPPRTGVGVSGSCVGVGRRPWVRSRHSGGRHHSSDCQVCLKSHTHPLPTAQGFFFLNLISTCFVAGLSYCSLHSGCYLCSTHLATPVDSRVMLNRWECGTCKATRAPSFSPRLAPWPTTCGRADCGFCAAVCHRTTVTAPLSPTSQSSSANFFL